METSHWRIITTCQHMTDPLGLYALPSHPPTRYAMSPTYHVSLCEVTMSHVRLVQ